MDYPVRYARVDGLNLTYQVVGDGPIDVVLVDEWATPLERRWDVPAIASRIDRLASFARKRPLRSPTSSEKNSSGTTLPGFRPQTPPLGATLTS